MQLWWKGSVPREVGEAIGEYAGALEIKVHPADYSRRELIEQILLVRPLFPDIDLMIPKEDGSGIVVTYLESAANLVEDIRGLLDVPVIGVVDDAPVNLQGGRQNDEGPHYGGAMMLSGDGHVCSTGFAVLKGSVGYLLSAAHCNEVPGDHFRKHRWNNGNLSHPYRIAPTDNQWMVKSMDSMLLDPDNGTRGRVYTQGVWGKSSRKVARAVANHVGNPVTTSGANSGIHRGLVIINDAFKGNCLGYSCTLIVAANDPGEVAAIGGDSGGPVFSVRADGRLNARGIIIQGARQVTCGAYRFNPNGDCFNHVRYVPIRPLLNVWTAELGRVSLISGAGRMSIGE